MPIAKKSFGQHFLKDKNILERIAGLVDGDFVIEIGPGTGALTEYLAQGRDLVFVEADRDLVPDLEARFDVPLIEGDAARVDFDEATGGRNWELVGNLPYNASAAIMENAMSCKNPPQKMVVMVQKEQADRMRAKPGDMGLLSVVVQLGYDVKKAFDVSPSAFSPKPRVDSSVLVLTRRSVPPPFQGGARGGYSREQVIRLAKAGFRARRKQLHRNLADAGIAASETVKSALEKLGYSPKARAQELSVEDWQMLAKKL